MAMPFERRFFEGSNTLPTESEFKSYKENKSKLKLRLHFIPACNSLLLELQDKDGIRVAQDTYDLELMYQPTGVLAERRYEPVELTEFVDQFLEEYAND
jgi:hypothetical protein